MGKRRINKQSKARNKDLENSIQTLRDSQEGWYEMDDFHPTDPNPLFM